MADQADVAEAAPAAEAPAHASPASLETVNATKAGEPSAAKRAIEGAGGDAAGRAQPNADHAESAQLPPRKKARKGSASGSTTRKSSLASSAEAGEASSEASSKQGSSNPADGQDAASPDQASEPAPPSSATSSQGASNLRTSFGSSGHQAVHRHLAMYNPLTAAERDQLVAAIRADGAAGVPPMSKRSLKWVINPIKPEYVQGNTWLEVFDSVLDKWCEAFLAANQDNIAKIGLATSLLQQCFMKRLESRAAPQLSELPLKSIAYRQLKSPDSSRLRNFASVFKPDHDRLARRQARRQAKEAKKAGIEQSKQQLAALDASAPVDSEPAVTEQSESEAKSKEDSPAQARTEDRDDSEMEDGEIGSNEADDDKMDIVQDADASHGEDGQSHLQPLSQDELHQRHCYYPGIPDDAVFCLSCSSFSHPTTNCPERTCKFCETNHSTHACPTRQRCTKCKQLGHSKSTCQEKLAMAPGEGFMECAFCQGQDHQEENCSELWQTYRPQIGATKKVRSLPMFCYCCGAEGHFGSDCGLAKPNLPPSETWSAAHASLYIDPNSHDVAIAYRGGPPAPPPDSRPFIPGRSIKPQSHVIFESDDDDDEDNNNNMGFIRAPANAGLPKRPGSIQITSNINFGGASSNQQQQQPPPQQKQRKPRAKKQRQQPQAPPGHSLPPRPEPQQRRKGSRADMQPPPPLPPGPPPRQANRGGGGGGGRGRGGFSSLSGGNGGGGGTRRSRARGGRAG